MRVLRLLVKIVLPLLILAGGVAGMRSLVLNRPQPRRQVKVHRGPLVETVTARKQAHRVEVRATGTVQASREVAITPQVNGRVVTVSANLVVGGFLREGEVLFTIESADFDLALERARAALAAARYELTRMESQAAVARAEWQRLGLEGQPPNPLALYEPQLENARAAVSSAAAMLRQAELDLERTVVRAPFNARVRSEAVEVGQYLRAGNAVAVLIGTDSAEILVPVPHEDLRWLSVPRHGEARQGSVAVIRFDAGNRAYTWSGRIVRSLGEVDDRGRMTRVVVEVADPFGLAGDNRAPELELGMFVDAIFRGRDLRAVIPLPRQALRDGATVWVVDDELQLRIQPVEVARLAREEVLIASGLEDGTRVVLTTLSGAADGMTVRLAGTDGEGQPR